MSSALMSTGLPVRADRPRRLLAFRSSNLGFMIGATILVVMVLVGIIVPIFAGSGTSTDPTSQLLSPSSAHWFGTDEFGRDIFVRCIAAIRIDLLVAIAVPLVGLAAGSCIGAVSATYGGWLDAVIMRITDILMAFPAFVLALIISASLGNSAMHAAIGLFVAYLPQFIRLTRAQALEVRSSDYIAASRVSGTSTFKIATQLVLPNSFRAPLVQSSLVAAWAVLDLAGLSFLGVGVQPPTPEWGQMIAISNTDVLLGDWWAALFPGLMIMISALSFQMIGDRLERGM